MAHSSLVGLRPWLAQAPSLANPCPALAGPWSGLAWPCLTGLPQPVLAGPVLPRLGPDLGLDGPDPVSGQAAGRTERMSTERMIHSVITISASAQTKLSLFNQFGQTELLCCRRG